MELELRGGRKGVGVDGPNFVRFVRERLLYRLSQKAVPRWVPANLMLEVTLQLTSIPSRGSRNTPIHFMLTEKGSLVLYAYLPYFFTL